MLLKTEGNKQAVMLADTFCRLARQRVAQLFDELYGPEDEALYKAAKAVLEGKHTWLERGIIPPPDAPADPATGPERPGARSVRREAAGVG